MTEEITVTALLREEKLQDVPFWVAAPTEEELRERGVDSIEGIAQSTPGFTVQNLGPGQSQVAIRGVSSGQIVRDQPGVKEQVGVYLDDAGISLSLFTPDIDLFDMSRVELLRGPQGTLFGAGSASGTLRYITNQPRLGERETVVELVANGTTDGKPGGSAKVAVNAPVSDQSALRVTAFFNSFGGYIDAVQPGRLTITPRVVFQKVETDGWNREDAFNILANVPEFQAAATATYQWSLGESWLAHLTGLYQYIGARFTQIGDQAAGFGLVNLNSFGANTIGGR